MQVLTACLLGVQSVCTIGIVWVAYEQHKTSKLQTRIMTFLAETEVEQFTKYLHERAADKPELHKVVSGYYQWKKERLGNLEKDA